MTGTAWQEHLGALFTVIVACTTVIGTGWIACATAVSLRRLVRSQKDAGIGRRDSAETRESEAEQEEEVGKGGARRLRKVLVVCLMSSDGLIAWVSAWLSSGHCTYMLGSAHGQFVGYRAGYDGPDGRGDRWGGM
jgi:hypothetical protein